MPTPEQAAGELSDAEKGEPTSIVDGRWPRFVAGGPEQVRATLEQMITESGADEIMVQDLIAEPAARHRSQELLAEAFDLERRPVSWAGAGAAGTVR